MEIWWGKQTEDPTFKTYKFCNVYRACDRVSQFLIRDVIYKEGYDEIDTLFRIFLFRLINRPQTWEELEKRVGGINWKGFGFEKYARTFETLPRPIYGNAFILCANKVFGYDRKYLNHLALVKQVQWDKVAKAQSLKQLYTVLRELPLIGPFMAYQIAIDMNYSPIFAFEEDEFVVAGPGAVRGIDKCWVNRGDKNYEQIIMECVENQEKEFARLNLPFRNLFGRRMKAIDCQNWWCETDKYCRVAYPEIASERTKIKSKYIPSRAKIEYFFPPKWSFGVKSTNENAGDIGY
jgi:hypothetical protein